jgi:hypothetical protein
MSMGAGLLLVYMFAPRPCVVCKFPNPINAGRNNIEKLDYKKNEMSTDMENGQGNKRARVTRGSWNPKHGNRRHYIVHKPSRLN